VRRGRRAGARADGAAGRVLPAAAHHDAAFGVRTAWTDRVTRYREVAEVRSAEYAAHADDEVVG
jgi:hypothetical protein